MDLRVHRHSEGARVLLDLKKDGAKWTSVSNLVSVKYACGQSGSPRAMLHQPGSMVAAAALLFEASLQFDNPENAHNLAMSTTIKIQHFPKYPNQSGE